VGLGMAEGAAAASVGAVAGVAGAAVAAEVALPFSTATGAAVAVAG